MGEPRGARLDETALARIGGREVVLAQVDLRLDVRGDEGAHGLLLPAVPNTWTSAEGREWLWLGPDEWLVVGAPDASAEIARRLEDALAGRHRSVIDVSANRAVIEISGGRRFDLLEQGCGLDLHPRSWRAGMCAQTMVAHIQVILQEREAATRVFVRPSFAGSLVDWLLAVS